MRQLRTRQSRPSFLDRGAEDRQEGAQGAERRLQEEINLNPLRDFGMERLGLH